jgi:hypothetical protein
VRIRPVLTFLALLAVWPASALAASRPSFARAYRGTISGQFESRDGGNDVKGTWKISGVVFRLTKTQAFEGGFSGLYKVAHGNVSYTETETGDCSYTASAKFGLAGALPHPNPSVPFALDQDPIGRKTILGLIDVTRKLDVTESCPDPNGGPATTNTRRLGLPALFDPQESRWRPGRRLRHTVRQKDKGTSESWSWNLKPGRS